MARPITKPRWTRQGVDGYVTEQDGRAVSVYGSAKKFLGFAYHSVNKKTCLDLHEQRVRAIKLKRLGIEPDGPTIETPRTIKHLIERYKELRLSKSIEMRKLFRCAMSHYLVGCTAPVGDVEKMAVWLTKRDKAPRRRIRKDGTIAEGKPLSVATRLNYLREVRALFALGISLGWLTRNPVDIMTLPDFEQQSYVPIPWEIAEQIITTVREINRQSANVLELILLTGLRIHEAVELHLSQIHDDHILIIGKGAGLRVGETEEERRKRKPRRIIPFVQVDNPENPIARWQSRLRLVVERCLAERYDNEKGLLFWRPGRPGKALLSSVVYRHFKIALVRLGIPEGQYVVHSLRKTTEHYFENVLRLNPIDFCDITGHSLQTYLAAYRKRRNPNQLVEAIQYQAKLHDVTAGNPTKLMQPVDTHHRFTSRWNR